MRLFRLWNAHTISTMSTAVPSSPVLPDSTGHFGAYGGVFVPETLVSALTQLERQRAASQAGFPVPGLDERFGQGRVVDQPDLGEPI